MTLMTLTPPRECSSSERDALVLTYYGRELMELDNRPLAGLTIAQLRASRSRLLAAGTLTRTPEGRYVPTSSLGVVA